MHKIVIDTDIGTDVDDAYAVAFALMRPELDILAITTAFGPTLDRLRILRTLARTVRDSALPPMAAGDGAPVTPVGAERRDALLGEVPNQAPFAAPDKDTPVYGAALLMESALRAHPGEVTLVTIGAMTNVARLLRHRPEIKPVIRGIASMGGSFQPDRIEYNIKCDPVAAAEVLSSGVPCALFSWEVTKRVVLEAPHMARLREADTPVTRALVELTELWMPHGGGKPGPVVYDISPLLHLFRPELYTMASHNVSVVTDPGDDIGRTRLSDGDGCLVATDMDAPAARDLLIDTLCGATP